MRNKEVIRQWQILREIETRRTGVTIHELAELTGVTSRTIRRDLQALQEAGFAVYDEGEENETKHWKLDAQAFRTVQEGLTVADVAALYLSRSLVEALSGWPLGDELRSAFQKIEQGLNPRTREFLTNLPDVISAKKGPRALAGGGGLVDVTRRLFDAIGARHVVAMQYFSATSNRAKSYEVHPYRLALAHGGVYLVAWVPAYGEFRTFAAARIQKLSVADDTFKRTKALPDDMFSASMGIFSASPEHVELEFDATAAPHVRDRLWHESQTLEELPDGRIRMTLDVSNDWALRSWLLGFGARVRVLAPQALAVALAEEFSRGAKLYGSVETRTRKPE
jgi:predicted DNA-binding transcriptional regulator YafY